MENLDYKRVESDCKDFIMLSKELDKYLDRAIGGADKREKFREFNYLETMDYVLVAYLGNIPVGCGALRQYAADQVEIKRVFVKEEYRKNSIASRILNGLIHYAEECGYQEMLLETGEFLRESVRLYMQFGFQRICKYGAYVNIEESLCMGKKLNDFSNLKYSFQREFQVEDLRKLYKSVGWISANYVHRMQKAFQNAGTVISVWENDKLIGLIEVLDDGELTAYIHYLLIRPEYQGLGIGRRLLEMVKEQYKHYLYLVVMCEEKRNIAFYEKNGFRLQETVSALQILSYT